MVYFILQYLFCLYDSIVRRNYTMLGIYNYTVILTYLGMLTGFAGITFAAGGNIKKALICLMIAGLCDMFDGKIASTMERTRQAKRFGVQIDSLSDLVCFGVLPALILYMINGGGIKIIPSAFYLLCALIRLAWFNVDEEERQEKEQGSRRVYYGLPVTSAALIFPLLMGLCEKQHWGTQKIGTLALILTAVAFLTPFRLKKPTLPGKIGMLVLGALGMLVVVMAGMDV